MKKTISLFLILILVIVMPSCKKHQAAEPTTFVLVHGAWQGAYVWDKVKSQLQQQGHKVIVVELPAHGNDTTPALYTSINIYRDKVIAAINDAKTKVVLVGHSMGGMVISATSEKIPDQIKKLVYVAAFVPANGQSLIELAGKDTLSLLGPSLIPSADMLTLDVNVKNRITIFCQDGSEGDKSLLSAKFRVEPAIPFGDPVTVTPGNFGRLDKFYVYTSLDNAISLYRQKQMSTAAGITKTYSIASGHSPFLSKPDELTAILLDLIK